MASAVATTSLVVLCALSWIALASAADAGFGVYSAYGPADNRDFWSPRCSAIGMSIAFSSVFSVMFYLGLIVVIIALLSGSYHACFRLFTKDMFKYDW